MKWFAHAATTAALVGVLAGCGGGGGGGGGGLPFPIVPSTPMTLAVEVNGKTVTADAGGKYSIKPGDMVTLTPNQGTGWNNSSTPEGAVTVRKAAISSSQWSAQIVNNTTAAAVFTVSAKASADAAQVKDAVFNVSAGNASNGTYSVFATNGTRQKLALNFDAQFYVMTDNAGVAVEDSFSADLTEAGSYLFKSSRSTAKAVNTRFRMVTDTVVGSFPFEAAGVPNTYAVQPFVASRALVTKQSDLDGDYNRLGIGVLPSVRDSNIRQARVTGGGTVFLLCNEVAITAPASCSPASVLTYNVTPGATPDAWNITRVTDPTDTGTFSIARVAGKNVYLSAGTNPRAPNDALFRIGLVESSTWGATTASGGDTAGRWGTLKFTATTYETVLAQPDATVYAVGYPLNITSASIAGIKGINQSGTDRYFGVQDGTISAVVGARGGPVAGYIQIGLVN